MQSALTFAVVLPALLVAHNFADHWVQTHQQAITKQQRGHVGRRACLAHVATYTAVTATVTALLWAVLGLTITPAGLAVGQLVSAVTHYWADRGFILPRLARWIGKTSFYVMGTPRPGKDDNVSLGTGAYALDQAWHWLWLFAAALLTAIA